MSNDFADPMQIQRISRRAFFRQGTLLLTATASATSGPSPLFAEPSGKRLKIGLITDLHHADKPVNGTRYYQETLGKLDEAAYRFEKEEIDFVVELGDLIDESDTVASELRYVKEVNKEFSAISKDRHCVLGNHCVYTLTKEEFLGGVEQQKSYYSFDRGNFHFVILDACFRIDGQPYGRKNFDWKESTVPALELDWLQTDLNSTKTVVFAHQRLDVTGNFGVKNAVVVRKVLENSGKVIAVFQGHSHENDLKEVGGIHYCTLRAMVEGSGPDNNGYSTVELTSDANIRLTGFRKQKQYDWH